MHKKLRKLILELSHKEGVGHIGPHMSIVDLIWCLYDSSLKTSPDDSHNNERDRFILSKGHAALALYVVLYLKKFISREILDSYCNHDGSTLGVHPKNVVEGVDFSSGSLGQGANYAVGAALAAKIQKSNRKIYCLISDGEINEGCVWEAFMFANHHKLNNLIFILDNNKQQALAKTEEVIEMKNIEEKIRSFGFEYYETDGHNYEGLKSLYNDISNKIEKGEAEKPSFINAHTISAKGVSFMEGTIKWHYKSLDDEQLKAAIKEIDAL